MFYTLLYLILVTVSFLNCTVPCFSLIYNLSLFLFLHFFFLFYQVFYILSGLLNYLPSICSLFPFLLLLTISLLSVPVISPLSVLCHFKSICSPSPCSTPYLLTSMCYFSICFSSSTFYFPS